MERSTLILTILLYVAFSGQNRISGVEEEKRVIRGQNVTLLCDCEIHRGSNVAWFRNCSHSYQPTLKLPPEPSRYTLKYNDMDKTHHLEITAITESDQGVYYCARVTAGNYYYRNKTTRLSVIDTDVSGAELVSMRSVCWTLLFVGSPVCVLLSSTCVYCFYSNIKRESRKNNEYIYEVICAEEHECERTVNGEICDHTEVFYTPQISSLKSE
ncbi:uncharacterized protein LOC113582958 [Electrophorus electricus]|uniref:uncharacterized protein LOC113582958 n=1 Tax=Electrophorus electricus TaxID=8005 RepID=UPI0015D00D23|nr:uncharacterized protein LOC113582958 [Electrophorus electricus]